MPRYTLRAPKWRTVMPPIADDIANVASAAMDDVSVGLKTELRGQIVGAGMGARLANTWQGRRYPNARASMDAAAFVFSKAPEIVDAFDRAPVIHTVNGRRFLAIPTANVPRAAAGIGVRGSTHRMSPAEVETYFNQDLKFARAGNGRLIAYIDVVGTAAGGFKRPTGKQLGRLYRGIKPLSKHAQVVMFILTATARMPKRLNVDDAATHWANQVPQILERRFDALS
jgi:hypothetical protein